MVDAAQVPLSGGTDASYGEVRWRTLINSCSEKSRDMVLGIAEFEPHGRLLPHRHWHHAKETNQTWLARYGIGYTRNCRTRGYR